MGIKDSWKQLAGRLKLSKGMEKWTVIFLTGLLLLVIALPADTEEKKKEQKREENTEAAETAYEETLETRIETLLADVTGVGKIKVMVTLASGEEKVVEKDVEKSEETSTDREGGRTGRKTSTETSVYTGESGSEIPYVTKELTPEIQGIVVIAEGGDNPIVTEEITEALQALFGLEPHKIKVMKHR